MPWGNVYHGLEPTADIDSTILEDIKSEGLTLQLNSDWIIQMSPYILLIG